MAEGKLSQAEIDALLATMTEPDDHIAEGGGSDDLVAFDFRRPAKFGREHMRSLQTAHEVFGRRLSSLLTHALRAIIKIEPVSNDQITYEDYVRALPTPSVLATYSVRPLPGPVVVELSTQMALTLLDRLLGGLGTPVAMRRPTELETNLLVELMGSVRDALGAALEPLESVETELESVEFNPAFVQAVAPNEMVLMLTYSLSMQTQQHAPRAEGLMSICYPFSTLAPAMGRLEAHAWQSGGAPADGPEALERPRPMVEVVPEVTVPIEVQLRRSMVSAADVAMLRPGDVLRLEHRVDEPAIGVVGGRPILTGRLGRTGRRLALQVDKWAEAPR